MVLAGLHKHIYRGRNDAAHCLPQTLAPGTARSRLRHCGEGAVWAPPKVGGDKHPGPGGSPEVACDIAPRCRLGGIGMGIHVAHPPTCL